MHKPNIEPENTDMGIADYSILHSSLSPHQREVFDLLASGKRVCFGGRMMGKSLLYKTLRAYIANGLLKEHREQWVDETNKLSVVRSSTLESTEQRD